MLYISNILNPYDTVALCEEQTKTFTKNHFQ